MKSRPNEIIYGTFQGVCALAFPTSTKKHIHTQKYKSGPSLVWTITCTFSALKLLHTAKHLLVAKYHHKNKTDLVVAVEQTWIVHKHKLVSQVSQNDHKYHGSHSDKNTYFRHLKSKDCWPPISSNCNLTVNKCNWNASISCQSSTWSGTCSDKVEFYLFTWGVHFKEAGSISFWSGLRWLFFFTNSSIRSCNKKNQNQSINHSLSLSSLYTTWSSKIPATVIEHRTCRFSTRCLPFQYFNIPRNCSVLTMSLALMAVCWLRSVAERGQC